MRRILFTILACTALSVAVPAVASAHNGHHHKRHHRARVRHLMFLAHSNDSSVSGSPTSGSPTTGTAPTAGTVTSFANNVLTITLANGNTVSGDVTNDTEVNCDNSGAGGDNGAEQDDLARDDGPGGVDNSGDQGDDSGDQGDDNGDQGDDNNNAMCTITPGMAVQKAELTINGDGAFWNEVELVSSSTSSTSPTSTSSSSTSS